jgi:hypothetical protein
MKTSSFAKWIVRGTELLFFLQKQFPGKAVTVKYPEYWAVLDPLGKTKHIVKLEHQNQIVFSEITQ